MATILLTGLPFVRIHCPFALRCTQLIAQSTFIDLKIHCIRDSIYTSNTLHNTVREMHYILYTCIVRTYAVIC